MAFPPWSSFGLEKLLMVADDISTVADFSIPESYVLTKEPLKEADFQPMAECLAGAYGIQHEVWDAPRIPVVFLQNLDVQCTFRILHADDGVIMVAGTATLKIVKDFPGAAFVHWVAVHPKHQGRGLAKILVAAVLREGRDVHGLTSAALNVVDSSLPAINTYEFFGFRPQYIEENNAARWEAIRVAQKEGRVKIEELHRRWQQKLEN